PHRVASEVHLLRQFHRPSRSQIRAHRASHRLLQVHSDASPSLVLADRLDITDEHIAGVDVQQPSSVLRRQAARVGPDAQGRGQPPNRLVHRILDVDSQPEPELPLPLAWYDQQRIKASQADASMVWGTKTKDGCQGILL